MRKIVVNNCYGGFDLSDEAIKLYCELVGLDVIKISKHRYEINDKYFVFRDIKRDDPNLVKVVETLKDKANGRYSKLEILEIPDDVEWEIADYDGQEWVAEKHRTWFV